MSTNLFGKITNGLEGSVYILPAYVKARKPPTFGEYVRSAMDARGLKPFTVERESKEEAEKRSVDVGRYSVSNQTVTNMLNDIPDGNYTMGKLIGLSWVLHRPIEEVVAHAFGFAARLESYQQSEAFKLWEIEQRIPASDAEYFARRVAALKNEIDLDISVKKGKR